MTPDPHRSANVHFLSAGGEMGALMRAHDWASSPLGSPSGWPQSLKVALRLLLNTRHPMFIWWGDELIQFYNDAYAASLGPEKHPSALGTRGRDTWPEIWDVIGPQIEQVLSRGEATWNEDQLVPIIRHGECQNVWWTYSFSPIDDDTAPNGIGGVLVICRETTAEVISRLEIEERYRTLFETIDVGFCIIEMIAGPDGKGIDYRFIESNPAFGRQTGLVDAIGRTAREMVPDLEQHWIDTYAGVASSGVPVRFEEGSASMGRWFDVHALRVGDPAQQRVALLFNDISSRRGAELALKASETRLAAIFSSATVGLSEVDSAGRFRRVNDELCRILGRSREELLNLDVAAVTLKDDLPASGAALQQVSATGSPVSLDKRYCRPDGSIIWANSRLASLIDGDAATGTLLVATVDLSERKETEQRLSESEARFRLMADAVPQIVWITDDEGRVEFFNRQWSNYTGVPYEATTAAEVAGNHVHPDDGVETMTAFDHARETGQTFLVEHRIRAADGSYRWFLVRGEPFRDPASGEIIRWFGASVDIHDRKIAEAALRELNDTLEHRVAEALAERQIFSDVVEGSAASIMVVDLDFNILAINRTNIENVERAYGKRPRVGDNLLDLLADVPDHQEQVRAAFDQAMAGEEFVTIAEFGEGSRGRAYYEVRFNALRDREGRKIGVAQTAYDVSERMRAQSELESAQEALRQSQKMEAMGQLTGGVAHDFNNLLTPIVGSLDMLMRREVGNERERRLIDGAAQSAERAKTLVQRLLAFARRQPLQPIAVDMAKLVHGMGDLVSSTTGPQIKVVVEAPDGLPPASADPNQLEMALLNLAVNARDAMPGGGTLRISADAVAIKKGHYSHLPPGSYVRLSVADTGSGMDEATLARAVEPFFSTKGVGKGTGLGLSMVHGLASQLGGALTIRSKVGLGTNIELWLPPSTVALKQEDGGASPAFATVNQGMALVVDDENFVRMSTAAMLADLGYAVEEASSAEQALQLIHAGKRFDLLVTDHLMEGMTGTQLIRILATEQPQLSALLVSGYAENDGVDADIPRLTKPFRSDELATALADLRPKTPVHIFR
ncbi:MAG: PAS domain S-box protein [Sphingomonas paucimobilis]